jgi:hypothetical protein
MAGPQRRADDKDGLEILGALRKLAKGGEHAIEQRVLEEQVLVGIAGERQFREHNEAGMIVSSRLGEIEDLPAIVAWIGDPDPLRATATRTRP